MTLVSQIITDAFREGNLIATSGSPTTDEQEEGLRLLNRYIASVYGSDVGEKYQEVLIGRNNISRPTGFPYYDEVPAVTEWFVPCNTRLILNITSAQTVYLNPTPNDGDRFAILDKSGNLSTYNLTVNANGRTIGSATSEVISTDSAGYEYVYRADTGDWTRVSPLVAADTFPFPSEFEDLFVIGLALRLNPRHGKMLDSQSGDTYRRLMKRFKARYRSSEEVGSELGLLDWRSYFGGRRDKANFERGWLSR